MCVGCVCVLSANNESPIRKFNRSWSCLHSPNSTTIHDSLNVCRGTSRCMPNSGTIVLTANYEYSWKVHVSSRRRARCKRGPIPLWNLQYIRISQHEYAYKLISRALNLADSLFTSHHRRTITSIAADDLLLVRFSVCRHKNHYGCKISVIRFHGLRSPPDLSACDYV